MERVKISIIGAGFVGSTTAFALMMGGLATDLVIVDINKDKADGEVMDLAHGAAFVKPVDIISGNYEDTKNSDIVIITAGAASKPGETRLDLLNRNYIIFKDMISNLIKYCPDAIYIVVTNPVDILSYITYKLSKLPASRVIGSGTVLDTSRLRYSLSKHMGIDARNIHTYILGEHGDSEITAWSATSIAGMNAEEYCYNICKNCDGSIKKSIPEYVKNAAYEIIKRKGYTNYAVALAVKRIVESILGDEKSILTVSAYLNGQYGIDNVYMGIPSIIGREGVIKILEMPLSEDEINSLRNSSNTLKSYINKLNV